MTRSPSHGLRVRRRYLHRPALDPHGLYWQGYQWSDWYDFPDFLVANAYGNDDDGDTAKQAGIYRFAVPRRRGLVYIGQTSVLRRRLAGHARAAKDARESTKRRLGFHHKLAAHFDQGGRIRVSWTALESLDKADRLGIECDLIAAHRTIVGSNPTWQFLAIGGDDDVGQGAEG
ncbi:MAG TPA: GIY-YIG nuclease family protein [Candidatus Angelobacter sp.]|nr:GIY-YIG nuclease family protein [Candidatus Angelobacter sp.]